MNASTPQHFSVADDRSRSHTTTFTDIQQSSKAPLDTSSTAAVDISAHLPVLLSGLRWLYDTEQPNNAILQHHGERLDSLGNRHVTFCPAGNAGRVVIILHVTHVDVGACWPARNPLRPGELDHLADLLTDIGETVVDRWNGHPHVTGSIALARPAHPSLQAAVQRYYAGCPTHNTVFCDCGWFRSGDDAATHLRQVHEHAKNSAAALLAWAGSLPHWIDPTGQLSALATRAGAVPIPEKELLV